MARLRDLHDLWLDPAEEQKLRTEKLASSEDLWRAIGPQYEEGMGSLHGRIGIARDRLAYLLGAAAAAGPGRRLTPGKVLLAALVLALLALAGLRAAEAFGLLSFPVSWLTAELDQAVVVPRDGLPAFHVLAESDLRLAPRPRTAGGITRKADAVGRYLLRPKRSGTIVRAEDLGPVPLAPEALAGRWIVTLQVDPSALGPQVTPGAETLLVLAAQEGAPSAATTTARVLAIEKGPGDGPVAVTVAIPRAEQEKVAAALGTSKVFLGASPVPGPSPASQDWTVVRPGWDAELGFETRVPRDGLIGSLRNPVITGDLAAYFKKAPCPSGDPPELNRLGSTGDSPHEGHIVDIYVAICAKDGWLLQLAVDHYHADGWSTDYPPGFRPARR